MATTDWRLDVFLDLYKLEFERADQLTSNLHAQWGYLTALATGIWLFSAQAATQGATAPLLASIMLVVAVAGFAMLAWSALLLTHVHLAPGRLERLGPLAGFEVHERAALDAARQVGTPDTALYDALCERVREARDNTASRNTASGERLWKARFYKAFAFCALVLMAILELVVSIGV